MPDSWPGGSFEEEEEEVMVIFIHPYTLCSTPLGQLKGSESK